MVGENRSKKFSVTLSAWPGRGKKRGADVCGDRRRRWGGELAVEVQTGQAVSQAPPGERSLRTSGVRRRTLYNVGARWARTDQAAVQGLLRPDPALGPRPAEPADPTGCSEVPTDDASRGSRPAA